MLSTILVVVAWLEETETTTGITKLVVVITVVVVVVVVVAAVISIAEVDVVEVVGHIVEANAVAIDVVRVARWCCSCEWHASLEAIETGRIVTAFMAACVHAAAAEIMTVRSITIITTTYNDSVVIAAIGIVGNVDVHSSALNFSFPWLSSWSFPFPCSVTPLQAKVLILV